LDKLPTIADLANAVAKVFAVDEAAKAAVGHLTVIDGGKLENLSAYNDRNLAEQAEYALAAGSDLQSAMANADFMAMSDYAAVVVNEGREDVLKTSLGDVKAVVYEGKDGAVLMLPKEKAVELEKDGLIEIVGKTPAEINKALIAQKLDTLKPELVDAGKKLVDEIIDGYTLSGDSTVAVKALLLRFNSLDEMISYMGIEGEITEASAGRAYINKLGEILSYEQEGAISEQERAMQIELARTLTGIAIASISDKETIGRLVKEGNDGALKGLTDRLDKDNKAVNRYVISKVMLENITVTKDSISLSGSLAMLKTSIETKSSSAELFDSIKNIDLGAVIAQGRRGKKNFPIMISDIKSARAISAAA
ncbi:MAG: hypothetical protein LBO62_02885, partial [Endomicrobium sp.]|nr:hypothetical protein [Endomicrobium sp.]